MLWLGVHQASYGGQERCAGQAELTGQGVLGKGTCSINGLGPRKLGAFRVPVVAWQGGGAAARNLVIGGQPWNE